MADYFSAMMHGVGELSDDRFYGVVFIVKSERFANSSL